MGHSDSAYLMGMFIFGNRLSIDDPLPYLIPVILGLIVADYLKKNKFKGTSLPTETINYVYYDIYRIFL
jgi:hypothetical protein